MRRNSYISDPLFVTVLLITFLEQLAVNAIRPLVSYRILDYGFGVKFLGLVMSAFAVSSLIGSLISGNLIERWSARSVSIVGSIILVAGFTTVLFVNSIALLIVSQAMIGFGQTLIILSNQSLLARFGKGIDQGFGRYSAVAAIGQMIGPGLATGGAVWLDRENDFIKGKFAGSSVVILLMVITVVVVSIFTYLLPKHEVINASLTRARIWPTLGQIKRILAQPKVKFAIFTGLILSLTPDLLIVFLPAIGEGNGWSPAFVGLLLSIRAGAGLLSRTLVRPMLRKLGRIRLLFVSLVLTSCSLLIFSVSTSQLLVILSLLILGFWNGLAVPVGMQWVGTLTKGPDQSMALGLRLAGNRFGQSVAPLVVSLGVLIGIGLSGFFILLSLTLFFTGMKFRNFKDEESGDISMGRQN